MPNQSPPTTLPANLRKARESKPMTQLALAHAIGYRGARAGSYISRAESGLMMPRVDTLTRIAGVLGVTLEKLINRGGK